MTLYVFFVGVFCCLLLIVDVVECQNLETNKIETSRRKAETGKNLTAPKTKPKPDVPRLVCPKNVRIPIFSIPCEKLRDCDFLGSGYVCCKYRCIKGIPPPKAEVKHSPVLFGLIDRVCPSDPIMEIFDVKECQTDTDCLPRICCPDTTGKAHGKSYCRTAGAKLDKIPVARNLIESFENMIGYLQCTQPPPLVLDLFPKECRSPVDCFPNLCCQEGARRYCRPPKKSLVTLIVGAATRLGTSEAAKQFINRITV